jgi:hypothetical protein
MHFFYVLKYGITWKLASRMVFGSDKYRSTLNRRFNELVNSDTIASTYREIVNEYIAENDIGPLVIDSMDIVNGNCNREHTSISHKLHKQAVRTTIIGTADRVPIGYQTKPARDNDSKLGFNLASNLHINDGKVHYLVGDKGYQMNRKNMGTLLKNNKLRLVVPKKRYSRKREYRTKNYKCKIKKIRHSKQMKEVLKLRIRIEHINSILHRSFRRLNTVYDRTMKTFNSFIELAIICMIIHSSLKNVPNTKENCS